MRLFGGTDRVEGLDPPLPDLTAPVRKHRRRNIAIAIVVAVVLVVIIPNIVAGYRQGENAQNPAVAKRVCENVVKVTADFEALTYLARLPYPTSVFHALALDASEYGQPFLNESNTFAIAFNKGASHNKESSGALVKLANSCIAITGKP